MRFFGFFPGAILARSPAGELKRPPSLLFSIVYGALSVGAVSLLAYSIFAYRLVQGTAAMYSAIAAVYLLLTGLALSRLVLGPGAVARFALLFATAFLAYALVWCAFWFGLRGKHHADLWGAAVGLALMTWLMQRAFARTDDFLPAFAVLFAFHTHGYYAGDVLHVLVPGSSGRLLWGVAHGLGFGAGLGYLLHHVQAPLRLQLPSVRIP